MNVLVRHFFTVLMTVNFKSKHLVKYLLTVYFMVFRFQDSKNRFFPVPRPLGSAIFLTSFSL
jgi:hypothetical protein